MWRLRDTTDCFFVSSSLNPVISTTSSCLGQSRRRNHVWVAMICPKSRNGVAALPRHYNQYTQFLCNNAGRQIHPLFSTLSVWSIINLLGAPTPASPTQFLQDTDVWGCATGTYKPQFVVCTSPYTLNQHNHISVQRASDQPWGRVEAGAVKEAAEGESPHSAAFQWLRDQIWLLAELTVPIEHCIYYLSKGMKYN